MLPKKLIKRLHNFQFTNTYKNILLPQYLFHAVVVKYKDIILTPDLIVYDE
jgi:hypothetical protein